MADPKITNKSSSHPMSLTAEQIAKDFKVCNTCLSTWDLKRKYEDNQRQIVGGIMVKKDDTKLKQNHLESIKKKKYNASENEIAQFNHENSLSGSSDSDSKLLISVSKAEVHMSGNMCNQLNHKNGVNKLSTIISQNGNDLELGPEKTVAVNKKEPEDSSAVQNVGNAFNLESRSASPELFEKEIHSYQNIKQELPDDTVLNGIEMNSLASSDINLIKQELPEDIVLNRKEMNSLASSDINLIKQELPDDTVLNRIEKNSLAISDINLIKQELPDNTVRNRIEMNNLATSDINLKPFDNNLIISNFEKNVGQSNVRKVK
ncbi:unnamed protein product [Meganyctiphanes norvegica]|uniref:Uncharacterized protein n=1 Tax=Meganyctiphanes norvegica TaxID=48144 RepID=A0AAV2Q7Z7_MEGNR